MSEYDLRATRRLLALLTAAARAARQGRGIPLARAAEIAGARSERELLDDVARLEELGSDPVGDDEAPVLWLENGEVNLEFGAAFGRPARFSLPEAAALLSALAAFEKDGGAAVASAARKLRRCIPEELKPQVDRMTRGLDLAPPPPGAWALVLQEAIGARREVTIEYRAVAEGEVRRRTLEPRLLFHREGAWYLAAWNVEKGAEHLYRLDRVVSVEPGTRTFAEHRGPPVERLTRRVLFFESGAERDVTLRFRGASARLARERHGKRARDNGDGSVSVTLRVTPGNHLYSVVLSHGGDATVEGPADVVEAFRRRVSELAATYV